MPEYALRIVVEKIDLADNNRVVGRDEVSNIAINAPKNIMDLGLRHGAQIELLKMIQDKLLHEQAPYLQPELSQCAQCGANLCGNGYKQSKFHAVFTDHDVRLQKLKCMHCKTSIVSSVKSLLGTSIHPDLYRLQCEHGANHTYRKAEENLTKMCNTKRKVNNHNRIKKITNKVGEVLSEKHKVYDETESLSPAKDIIIQVDGGHIKTTETEKRSIEVMSAKIYRPESVVAVTKQRREIVDRHCVASAKADKQSSMKQYVKTAAKLQGLSAITQVTGLADGAKNCWGIIKSLENDCKKLECILDWFHIAKKFEPVIKSSSKTTSKLLKEVKSSLWAGKIDDALGLLKALKSDTTNENKSKINGLYLYINSNKEFITNYSSRAKNQLPYTSQVAESTVEHLINDRHKRSQKMQWSRKGAHHVLQIRASMASHQWVLEWQDAIFDAIKGAA